MSGPILPRPVAGLLGALVASASAGGCADAPGPADTAPNVLLLTIDTLRADALEPYGYGRNTSPRLAEFAESAVVFERAIASASWTIPSFASLFTGLLSSAHRCWTKASRLDGSYETMAEVLTRNGYDSACFVSHIFLTSSHGLQQGFVHFDDSISDPEKDIVNDVSSERISDRGIRFLDQKAASPERTPWLLWLHYFDPHSAYMEHEGITEDFVSPERTNRRLRDRDVYDGEIAFTDRHVGRVLDALERNGMDENTIVVLVSDHGEAFGEHGAYEHGSDLFEELVRVPLLIRAPGVAPRRVAQPVRTVDVLPTVLDLAGIPFERDIEGMSLRPALEGRQQRLRPPVAEIRQSDDTMMEAIISLDGRWKLVRHIAEGRPTSLYDLEADPGETKDVAATHPDVVDELARLLDRMVDVSRKRGRSYGQASGVDFTPSALETIKGLGYGGN